MKTMKNWLLSGLLFLMVSTVFSQGKITGAITDGQNPLPGANVAIKGTSASASTGFDGKFTIDSNVNSGQLIISYIGFASQTVDFTISNGVADLGNIILVSSNELSEVVVKSGVIDLAKDRKTPVAVSTINATEIQAKLGSQEFPEVLKNTPSVYASKAGGGFGDSRIVIRGFDQKNIAVMINGVPVNDMEGGSVYWSNWAGLSDVTSAMQVQRGLGASKLAISSVGGTINVITKTSDMKEGGSVSSSFGNDKYLKTQASYNTGVMKNGLSASVLFSRTAGDGYVDGTKFEGYNYFMAFGYKINDKNSIQFTFTGAPQWHNQRSTSPLLTDFLKFGSDGKTPNIKYNSDWGLRNGEEANLKTNYYHKPVMSLNWDYDINSTTKFSTVVYGSWGRGGGSTSNGGIKGQNPYSPNSTLRTADGIINFDLIDAWNSGQTTTLGTRTKIADGSYQNSTDTGSNKVGTATVINTTSGITQYSSVNSHNWYGTVLNLDKKLSDSFNINFGIEGRTYTAVHYQTLNDLFGATNYLDKTNKSATGVAAPTVLSTTYAPRPNGNPWVSTDYQERLGYSYDSKVNYYGAFSQLEYSKDNLSAFIQAAVSSQGYKRDDHFSYAATNPLSSTDYENLTGGDVKAGVNYNINEQHNVFVNGGFYSKQPFFTSVYPNFLSVVNDKLTNEKIKAVELGYGFRSRIFTANLNAYYTTWDDRFTTGTDPDAATNPGGLYTFSGVNETHTGVELDVTARLIDKLKLNGMISIGDWKYDGNATSNRFDSSYQPVAGGTAQTLYLDGVKVGNAAQTTMALGAAYEILKGLNADANLNYSEKLYGNITPSSFTSATNKGAMELPGFATTDAGVSYKWVLGEKLGALNFRFNVNNVFDKIFINESFTNFFADDIKTAATGTTPAVTYAQAGALYNGVATVNKVYFGYGRTWNFTLRYEF
ncbi:carboxypeptidase-like protein [Flavobacterium sp. 1]|uniref:TonB-dependent receptor n=1 Tax=Flavobacterium sp. 1 TaxID=2035200 RepID=UPI000C238BAC|nr:TonB-dependent receptor [Flavobacterium sp. 1]PJJ10343.1 carboxypeptidase-like protein [Flavobacterium sp. 1]